MKRVGIITNQKKDPGGAFTQKLLAGFDAQGLKAIPMTLEELASPDFDSKRIEALCTVGGDGTLIAAARCACRYELPLIGVNRGTLGYLAEIEPDGIREAAACLLKDQYIIQERMMLKGEVHRGEERIFNDRALNDMVLTRIGHVHAIHFEVNVDGSRLCTYDADGLILSTPTGSTAYNLSAGGPVVAPQASLIILTPICSHSMNTRSIVLPDTAVITIKTDPLAHGADDRGVALLYDGNESIPVTTGDLVTIRKSPRVTRLIRLSHHSFIELMSRKMN